MSLFIFDFHAPHLPDACHFLFIWQERSSKIRPGVFSSLGVKYFRTIIIILCISTVLLFEDLKVLSTSQQPLK